MKLRTALAATAASAALSGAAFAQDYRIGITQNNVGVDSYQTTYEQAFIDAAEANDNVEAVVLDAGGDVARQIAQIEDLIQQRGRCHHHLADQWRGGDPRGAQGQAGRHPGRGDQFQHRRAGVRFHLVLLGAQQYHAGRALGRDHVRQVQGHGHRGRGPGRAHHRPAGLYHRDRTRQGLRGSPARGLPRSHRCGHPAGRLEPRKGADGHGGLPDQV